MRMDEQSRTQSAELFYNLPRDEDESTRAFYAAGENTYNIVSNNYYCRSLVGTAASEVCIGFRREGLCGQIE